MKRIVFATGNQNKMREIREIMKDFDVEVLSMKEAGAFADPEETGTSFEENSLIKARAVWKLCHNIVLADDSGLEIDALDKEPGIYSARYMGKDTSYDEKNRNLIGRLSGIPDEKRTARFICVISCVFPKHKKQIVAKGECEGIIIRERRGESGFGYDPVFYIPEVGKTFAEMTEEEKNKISHRGRAMRDFIKKFSDFSDECLKTGRHL